MFILEDASSGETKGVLVCTNAMTSELTKQNTLSSSTMIQRTKYSFHNVFFHLNVVRVLEAPTKLHQMVHRTSYPYNPLPSAVSEDDQS
jgi:hypothetical protein